MNTPVVAKKIAISVSCTFTGCALGFLAGWVGLQTQTLRNEFDREMSTENQLIARHWNTQVHSLMDQTARAVADAQPRALQSRQWLPVLRADLAHSSLVVAASLYQKSRYDGAWHPYLHVVRADNAFRPITKSALRQMWSSFPISTRSLSAKKTIVAGARLHGKIPILRLVFQKKSSPGQMLIADIEQETIEASLFGTTDTSSKKISFLLDPDGKVVAQSKSSRFSPGEDLSHMSFFESITSEPKNTGILEYYPVPGGSLQIAAFQKLAPTSLILITQIPRSVLYESLYATLLKSLIALCGIFGVSWAVSFLLIEKILSKSLESNPLKAA